MEATNPKRCSAHKHNGDQCAYWAKPGQSVCRFHGGNSPQALAKAQLRILAAADPAAAELVRLTTKSKNEGVRLAAIKDLLDRAGMQTKQKVEVDQVISFTLELPKKLGTD